MQINKLSSAFSRALLVLMSLCALILSACGGGSSSGSGSSTETASTDTSEEIVTGGTCDNGSTETEAIKQVGILAGVEGVAYESETTATVDGIKKTLTGVTSASGEYEYYEMCGEDSEVSVCHIKKCGIDIEIASAIEIVNPKIRPGVIGQFDGSATPRTLKDVIFYTYRDQPDPVRKRIAINVYQFLMALDDDNDPGTGIKITSQILELGKPLAQKIDFTRNDFDSAEDVIDYLKQVANRESLATDTNAKLLLQKNLANLNRYIVTGTITGKPEFITLLLNGSESITENEEGRFFFQTELMTGDVYTVNITQHSSDANCIIQNDRGIVGTSIVNDVAVICRRAE